MKNRIYLLIVFLFGLTLQSCLKDEMQIIDPSRGHNVIEFKNYSVPISAYTEKYLVYLPKTLEVVPTDEFKSGVTWAGPEDVAPQDITVNLVANDAAVIDAGYDPLDPSTYSFPSSVTIKKGERFAEFTITVNPDKFDLENDNAFALEIQSASYGEISGNNGLAIFTLPVKNELDGKYRMLNGPQHSLLAGFETNVTLETINGTRAKLLPGLGGYYSNEVFYIINEDGSIGVDCPSLSPVEVLESSFDHDTKALYVLWTAAGGNYLMEDIFTYRGPRD